ncbi:MAG: ankyrin repeat protein [Alphaproteobacteria bacterium]|jgi:ankyrin repeat protein
MRFDNRAKKAFLKKIAENKPDLKDLIKTDRSTPLPTKTQSSAVQSNASRAQGENNEANTLSFESQSLKAIEWSIRQYAANGNTQEIQQTLKQLPEKNQRICINSKDLNGDTALILAVDNGHIQVIEALLTHKNININAQNSDSDTALMLAAYKGNKEIVEALLKYEDIGVHLKDESGQNALMIALNEDRIPIVMALLEHKDIDINATDGHEYRNTVLMMMADQGHVDIVEALLQDPEIDINIQNYFNDTALIIAADKGHVDIVEALLQDPEIDINIKNNHGDTALIIANHHNNTEIVTLLGAAEKEEKAEKAAAELIEAEEKQQQSSKPTKNQNIKKRRKKAKAVITIQSVYRKHQAHTKFNKLKQAVTTLQAHHRGNDIRKNTNIPFKQAMSMQAQITELTNQLAEANKKPDRKEASTQTNEISQNSVKKDIKEEYRTIQSAMEQRMSTNAQIKELTAENDFLSHEVAQKREQQAQAVNTLLTSFENNDRLMNTLRELNKQQTNPDLFVSPDDKQWLSHFLPKYEDAQADFAKSALAIICEKHNLSELNIDTHKVAS